MLSRRALIILSLTLGLTGLLLGGIPLLIKHYATTWLLENGGERVQFRDVDFNPFTATLVLKGLQVDVGEETTLAFDSAAADLAWMPLLSKQIAIQSVTFSGFDILVDDRPEDALLLGGIILSGGGDDSTATPTKKPWLAGVEALTLNDFNIRFKNSELDLNLELEQLTLGNVAQWAPESLTRLAATGTLNGAPLELSGELAPFAENPRYTSSLTINGLPLDGFSRITQPQLARLAGFVSYTGDIEFRQQPQGFKLKQNGVTRLQSLDISMTQPELNILNKGIELSGSLDLLNDDNGPQIKLDYDATFQGVNIVADDQTLELVRADSVKLSKLLFEGSDKIAVADIAIEQFSFGRSADDKADDAFIDVKHFQVSNLALENNLLSIDKVHYRDGISHMKRDAAGNFRVVGILDSMNRLVEKQAADTENTAPAAEQPGTDSAEAEPLAVKIDRIEVSGNSRISFVDENVKPAFSTVLKLNSILIEALDTRTPEKYSPFKLDGGIGKHTKFALHGKAKPFREPLGLDLKANIDALDLPPLSPYTRQSLGLVLDSGTLDSDASVIIGKKKMDGKIELKLHQLEFENVASENSLQSRLPVPLNVALDTLRDKHNTISLEIPVQGDPANPDFSVNDALSQALATGVQKGALTYLSLALQPYGSLIAAARYAGEEISKVRLKPVEFETGQSLIDDADKDYLSKVAKVLTDRPKLAIKICGVAVKADADYFREQAAAKQSGDSKAKTAAPAAIDEAQLQALAEARAASVKDYMIETFKTPAARLVGCRPRLEIDKDKAAARTDLLI